MIYSFSHSVSLTVILPFCNIYLCSLPVLHLYSKSLLPPPFNSFATHKTHMGQDSYMELLEEGVEYHGRWVQYLPLSFLMWQQDPSEHSWELWIMLGNGAHAHSFCEENGWPGHAAQGLSFSLSVGGCTLHPGSLWPLEGECVRSPEHASLPSGLTAPAEVELVPLWLPLALALLPVCAH